MTALMVVAVIVSLAQLGVLGWGARSVRLATLARAAALGAVVCAPLAAGLEWAATRAVAAASGRPLIQVVARAAWTYDPAIEEIAKVAPLALAAWLWPKVHRQLGWTDHLLIGSALGLGFALTEAALRFGRVTALANTVPGGYLVRPGLMASAVVPSLGASLTSWQPAPVATVDWLTGGADTTGHPAWTAATALGVAWTARRRGWARPAGLAPLLLAGLAHAARNGDAYGIADPAGAALAGHPAGRAATWLFAALQAGLPLILAATTTADRIALARAATHRPDLRLPGEPPNLTNPLPLLKLAALAPPWTLLAASLTVLKRRAALFGLAAGLPADSAGPAAQQISLLARATDKDHWKAAAPKLAPPGWRAPTTSPAAHADGLPGPGQDRPAPTTWRAALWLTAVLPGLAYLVAGGFPATRRLQQAMAGTAGTALLLAGLAAGTILAASLIPALARALKRPPHPPWHDARLTPALTLTLAAATLPMAAALAARVIAAGPDSPLVRGFHAIDALAAATTTLGLALMILAFVWFPPGLAAVALAGGGQILVPVISEALLAHALAGLLLTLDGLTLNQTAAPQPEGTSGPGGPGGGTMMGQGRASTASWAAGEGKSGRGNYFRVDVENPNPGQRPGQIHIHLDSPHGPKYLYDPTTGKFQDSLATRLQEELLSDPKVVKAINNALRFFGLPLR